MGNVNNMSDLFDRLNDLKSVFKYGQRLIPIIQSIIDFMKETVPLLEEINASIAESTVKIPKAKDQITKVSSATELATTEILDIVDLISTDIDEIEAKTNEIRQRGEKREKIWNEIKKLLKDNPSASGLITEYEELDSRSASLEMLHNKLQKIKSDIYNITLSLQVQDITSQQLASVNHLIETVRRNLAALIVHLDESDFHDNTVREISFPKGVAFDPDASYTKSVNKQSEIDIIVNDNLKKTSQDDIDKLFS